MHRKLVMFFSGTGAVIDVLLWSRGRGDLLKRSQKYVQIPEYVVEVKTNLNAIGFLEKCVCLT